MPADRVLQDDHDRSPVAAGPAKPRWTHVALPSGDLEASIAFYSEFTPLVVLERFSDAAGRSAWLCDGDAARLGTEYPFVLVLVDFRAASGTSQPVLAPFAHLGIEVPRRSDVEEIAARAEAAGCLLSGPRQLPPPVGYVCMLSDPDGNVVEISFDQGVYAAFAEHLASVGLGSVRDA